jgi:hypothetical protein
MLFELLAVVMVLATLGAVVVPLVVPVRRHIAADGAVCRFALALRYAQAVAQAEQCRLRVRLTDGGAGYVVERIDDAGCVVEERGTFCGALGASNYPADAVDFTGSGWPLSEGTSTPRAGTFTFGSGSVVHSVVVQLTGRVRCR